MILYGASGHAKVVLDILINQGVDVCFIFDDNPSADELLTIPIRLAKNQIGNERAIISIGNNIIRQKISQKYKLDYQTAIHPKATVSVFSKIQEGTVVMANVVINPDVIIGKHCIINTSAVIEHDCEVGDFVHVSPNVSLAGGVKIGEGTHVGIGASVIQGVEIGKWVTVGAGAVIIKNIPDFSTVVGNPGRVIKNNK